jgi:hypothetical protein
MDKKTFSSLIPGIVIGDAYDWDWEHNLAIDESYRISDFVAIQSKDGSEFITKLVRKHPWGGKPDFYYTNKTVVVVDVRLFGDDRTVVAAYSYDAMTVGFINIQLVKS